ncbi:IS30 family transposase [Branchiibius sp. NY16-3462-2]|uniref:IS30 family transposase n=1 Tax=Branchiibius sp. NY16-3462-2 TaxID=1807500 RepID=UPI0025BF1D79|nr:IS30 family transposase [Branchiibius sp. NY16-3462-2]
MLRDLSAERRRALRLLSQGMSAEQVARGVGVSYSTVRSWAKLAGMTLILGRHGGAAGVSKPAPVAGPWTDELGRLNDQAPVLIHLRLNERVSLAKIATELGVHRSTVWREVARGRDPHDGSYRARQATAAARARRRRPRACKLGPGTPLRAEVVRLLTERFSPEQIEAELLIQFPDRDDMHVSYETIYQALYVQGKGSLRQELLVEKALRTGRSRRRPRSNLPPRASNRSWIGQEAMITERPAEVADRAVPGHWEGDLVIGTGGSSALITLVERSTRYVLIRRLPLTHDSATVAHQLTAMMRDLPASLRKTVTWDQGAEMARHAEFTLATNCQVFFCDPHSPWQRGSNENTNGLIRDFYPKSTDFAAVSDEQIAEMQRLLNIRPRKTLGWAKPANMLNEILSVAPTT